MSSRFPPIPSAVAKTQTAFPRWMATLRRWRRKSVALFSPVTAVIFLPRTLIKLFADSPNEPSVSTATGTKLYIAPKWLYLVHFLISASLATAPWPVTALFRWLWAKVSGQVKSHTKHLPESQGTRSLNFNNYYWSVHDVIPKHIIETILHNYITKEIILIL